MIKVDPEDAWRLDAFTWQIQKTSPSYAFRTVSDNGKVLRVFLHREILDAQHGMFVDHKDGDGLNCTRSNIRICSHADNMKNRKVAKSNKLGVKGVFQRGRSFIAQIKADGKRFHLGSYATIEAATQAYKVASIALHGEFARQ